MKKMKTHFSQRLFRRLIGNTLCRMKISSINWLEHAANFGRLIYFLGQISNFRHFERVFWT